MPRKAKTSQDTIARGEALARGPTCRPRVNDPCSSRLFMTSSDGADSRFRPKEVGFSADASFDAGRGRGQPPRCMQSQQLSHPGQGSTGSRGKMQPHPHQKGAASSPCRSSQEPSGACTSPQEPHCFNASMPHFHVHFVPFPFRTRCMAWGRPWFMGRLWAVHGPSLMGGAPCGARAPQGVRAPGRAPGPNKGQGQRISLGDCNLVVAVRVCMTDMRMWEWMLARFPL